MDNRQVWHLHKSRSSIDRMAAVVGILLLSTCKVLDGAIKECSMRSLVCRHRELDIHHSRHEDVFEHRLLMPR
jgi:hypothetical protein